MTPDAPLSDEQIDKYEAAILNGQLMHGAPQIVYDLVQSHRALASERDELKYKMQAMADMVGEENWSLRNQLADAQARANEWKQCYQSVVGETYEDDSIDTLKQQHAALRERCERLEKANSLLMECSYQSHSGHWDRTGQSGAGCDECNRARRLREEAKALATGAEEPKPVSPAQRRSCNLHLDCDEADSEAQAIGSSRAGHCHNEDCEDCFGQ